MSTEDRIRRVLSVTVEETNRELPPDRQLADAIDTELFGESGVLDSLQLVTFVLVLEDHLRDEFQQPISLTDDRAMSQRNSPFRSLRSLATYLQTVVEPAPSSSGTVQ